MPQSVPREPHTAQQALHATVDADVANTSRWRYNERLEVTLARQTSHQSGSPKFSRQGFGGLRPLYIHVQYISTLGWHVSAVPLTSNTNCFYKLATTRLGSRFDDRLDDE